MLKNVESNIRNVGRQPGDLGEIVENVQQKPAHRLPEQVKLHQNIQIEADKEVSSNITYTILHLFETNLLLWMIKLL